MGNEPRPACQIRTRGHGFDIGRSHGSGHGHGQGRGMLAGYRIWEHLWEKQPEVENAYGNAEMSTAPVKIIGIRRQAAIDFHESLTTFPGLPGQMHMPGINNISWAS